MTNGLDGPLEARDALVGRLTQWVAGDARLQALWLQGSLAAGTADPWSDIDAYVAVRDDAVDEVWAGRAGLLTDLGGPLAWSDATTPGMKAVHALMGQGVRLDLFFEAAGAVAGPLRPHVRVLVGTAPVTESMRIGSPANPAVVGAIIGVILRMTRQGSTWPLRLLGRGEWATLAMMELDLINAQCAQLMAVAADPANFYVNPFAIKARLSQVQREQLDGLTARALAALGQRDAGALKPVHLAVFDLLGHEGRHACAALSVGYPIGDGEEAAIRSLLEARWPA